MRPSAADLRAIARQATKPAIRLGVVVAADGAGGYDVQVPGDVDAFGNPVPYRRLRSLSSQPHVVGDQVVLTHLARRGTLAPQMWVILEQYGGQTGGTSPRLPTYAWPMSRQAPFRWSRADIASIKTAFAAFTSINTNASALLRAAGQTILQVAAGDVWRLDSAGAVVSAAAVAGIRQVVLDLARARVYLVDTTGLQAYSLTAPGADFATALLTSHPWDGLVLEPMLLGTGLVIVDSSDPTAWALRTVNPDNMATASSPATVSWAGWTEAPGPANSAASVSYPIYPYTRFPFFSPRLASVSPQYANLTNSRGEVICCGNDPDFTRAAQEEVEANADEDATHHNWGQIQSRSQILCVNPATGAEIWRGDGWSENGSANEGFDPMIVCDNGAVVIEHYERAEFQEMTFSHLTNPADLQDGINAYVAGSKMTWMEPGTPGGWFDNTSPAPRPVWDPNYVLAAQIVDRTAWLEPTFSQGYTRDYKSVMSHGLRSRNAWTGAQIADLPWTAPDAASPTTTTWDSGDPYLRIIDPIWGAPPPKLMVSGTPRAITVVRTGNGTPLPTLLTAAGLADNERVIAYAALEQYAGDEWTCDDAAVRSTFYQGYMRVFASQDLSGNVKFGTVTPIWNNYTDPEGRWSQHTAVVTYHCWAVESVTADCAVSDLSYGYDWSNAISDGTKAYLLPRMVPAIEKVKKIVWWPPGTVLGENGYPAVVNSHGDSANNGKFSDYLTAVSLVHSDMDPHWHYISRYEEPFGFMGGPAGFGPDYDETVGHWYLERVVDPRPPFRWYLEQDYWGWDNAAGPRTETAPPWTQEAYEAWPDGGWGTPGWNPYTTGDPRYIGGLRVPPSQDLHATILALDVRTLEERWRRDLGTGFAHLARPSGTVWQDRIYLWMAGTVYQVDTATGTVVSSQVITGSDTWAHAELVALDGMLALTGDGGLRFI